MKIEVSIQELEAMLWEVQESFSQYNGGENQELILKMLERFEGIEALQAVSRAIHQVAQ